MATIFLEAETRTLQGKGASRRLRRLDNKVPAVLYGGDKKPQLLHLLHNKVVKALETESIYSSVFDLHVDGKVEHVILKDLQRHPYKPVVLHMDLQRVSPKDILIKMIPLHFVNEQSAKGVKAGGMVNHTMSQVEIRCQAKDLPEFIEVDLSDLELNGVIHLSDLKLPKSVKLAIDPTEGDHDHPVVSIHLPRAALIEDEDKEAVEEEVPATKQASSEEKSEEDQE